MANAVARALRQLSGGCHQAERPPRHLIAFDGHPGHFVERLGGSTVLVDLEKRCYSYPGLDIVHASAQRSDAALVDHVRDRVDHWLSAPVVERVRHELGVLGEVPVG